MDTGSPEQDRGEEEDGKADNRVIGEPVAEGSEEGDIAEENREGEEEGISIEVVTG